MVIEDNTSAGMRLEMDERSELLLCCQAAVPSYYGCEKATKDES